MHHGNRDSTNAFTRGCSRPATPQGHVVVRVAAGGASYQVFILDDTAESYRITAVHGPYDSR